MMELQASVENVNMLLVERNQAKEKAKISLENLREELQHVLTKKKMMPNDPEPKEIHGRRLIEQTHLCLTEIRDLDEQEHNDKSAIFLKKSLIRLVLEELPKQQRA